ncbi:hypothetical protein FA15DRAFT_666240 [Coprinopsis marcescibilis]|uniref:MYND-type domain-containing protein n=1 Tax=Coprinopsis marcescibilis TaxID=230819 RepID=A0A5C3L3I0_COPMA|nr:hypothetical protein FA15DRAFT_666240 [Coprinopsis marcescibilis]
MSGPTPSPSIALSKFNKSPKKVLENAKNGVLPDLLDVVNYWHLAGPKLLALGVTDVFLHHLDASKTPINVTSRSLESLVCRYAWLSLVGLSKFGNFFNDDSVKAGEYDAQIIAGWPGLFKWSAYFFAAYVEPPGSNPQRRKNAIELISGSWYSVCRTEAVIETMVRTKGSLEIATRMWILQDADPGVPSIMDIPSATAALNVLIKKHHEGVYDRVVSAAGGKAEHVAKMALSRIRSGIKDHSRIHETRTILSMDLAIHLSRPANHPLRHAFLNGNTIVLCTNIAVTVSQLMISGGHPDLIGVMADAFTYLANCLPSTDGFSWVTQSVKAGLLTAYVDCSPFFARLDEDDQAMMLEIIDKTLPKYLVYRSVAEAVHASLANLKAVQKGRVESSVAKDKWREFHRLAMDRYSVTQQAKAMKGKLATCDNVECQRIDDKDTFRRCSACYTSLYCSKECQVAAWKAGHKNMCILKQQERLEGKYQSISKSDAAFWHFLAPHDACRELPSLLRLAKAEYPGVPLNQLYIAIDYTVNPNKFSVIPLADYETRTPATSGSPNSEARNDALIERVRENVGKFTLLQSRIANGQGLQMVVTLISGKFWEQLGDGIEELQKAMAKMALNSWLTAQGEEATF